MNQQPRRILRVITRLNISSPALHAILLTERLSRPDYESLLVCGTVEDDDGDMAYLAEQHQVTPYIIPALRRPIHPWRDAVAVWRLYRLMREFRPDVVHTHTAKSGFLGRLAAKLAGVPVIIHTFHGHNFQGYFTPGLAWVFVGMERLAARWSDTIITLTETLRRELAETYHIARRAQITVLPLGLDLSPFINVPRHCCGFRQTWGIPADTPLVGIVGRLATVKNHGLFLEAAALIHQQRPDVRFVIVGDGLTRPEVEAQIERLSLGGVVTLTGWQRDIPPVYSDLNVLAVSSLNEGTPAPVIEALAARCPVVATAVGGLPDMLDQGALGTLVPPDDPAALAEGILATLDNPPETEAAQAIMLDRYGIDRLVSDLDGLYRGLLARKRRQTGTGKPGA
ncbi:MAG: glycosyltransferase family 4 protein [Anaerolineaceae bacterium]|nr:glycosyltransferase family 4 protein [Anaerolineaceae bacterium]